MPFINEENKYMEKFTIEIEKLKSDLDQQKKAMDNQIKLLRTENEDLLRENDKIRNKKDVIEDRIREHRPTIQTSESNVKKSDENYNNLLKAEEELANYKINFEQIIIILREEEKNRINLEEEINNLKGLILKLKEDIQIISNKYERKCQDFDILDKINNEMRNNYYELKPKYEDLVKINAELKTKIIEKSNEYNNLFDSNKGIYKKISTLQKRNEELEKEQSKFIIEMSAKEERMTALRNMNLKLENKIAEVMKKMDKIKYIDETSSQIQKKYNELYEIIANLNMEKNNLTKENLELKGQYLKRKEETVEIETNNLSYQSNNDSIKNIKRNCRSSSLVTSNSFKNSKNNNII